LSAVAGLISCILVAVIGFYATNIYDSRSKDAEKSDRQRNVVATELQTVEKFFPHLASKDEAEKAAAIQAISSLANPELAAKMAKAFGGSGARDALTKIASALPETRPSISYALTDLFKDFGKGTARVVITCKDEMGQSRSFVATAVIVAKNGFALTAARVFDECNRGNIQILASVGSKSAPQLSASLVKEDRDLDLALVRLPDGEYQAVKFAFDTLRTGEAITVLGFPWDADLTASTGIISSMSGEGGKFFLSAQVAPGNSGSPIFNSHGEVIGLILGNKGDLGTSQAVGVPISFARPLLLAAGIQ
jgi:S1-C subfamily serine protease